MILDRRIGSLTSVTLLCNSICVTEQAWCGYLSQHVVDRGVVSSEQASALGCSLLANAPFIQLANDNGQPWLTFIEAQFAESITPFQVSGWSMLELPVLDVDAIATRLAGSPFTILRPVADLSISNNIRAVQVQGPCGEILYLSQIKGPVDNFELPTATCAVDLPYMAMVSVPNRAEAVGFYQRFFGVQPMLFESKITVVNRLLGYPELQKHPVALFQIAPETYIELQQIEQIDTSVKPHAGIFSVGFTTALSYQKLKAALPDVAISRAADRCYIQSPTGDVIELLLS